MQIYSLSLLFFHTLFSLVRYAGAVPVPYDPSPFTVYGQLLGATLDDPTDPLSGGSMFVNNQNIVVPKNSLIGLPSITVPWSEIFHQLEDGTWVPDLPNWAAGGTGDMGWEVSVIGNRVNGQHIAGIIYLFQELLEQQTGFITSIDYTTGALFIGGDGASPDNGAIKAYLSDPEGVFGLPHGDYPLWTTDTANPSVRALTGFPVCVPRVNPATGDDPLCPSKNRPLDDFNAVLSEFTFFPPSDDPTLPDPLLAAPLLVGDYVTVSGVWVADSTAPNGRLLVVYALEANLGIYTTPSTYPAYITIVESQWGIAGSPRGEIAETRIEGYVTDQTASIEVFAIDVNPCTGVQTTRTLGVVTPRLTGRRGQWEFRPDFVLSPSTREVGARISTIPIEGPTVTPNGIEAGIFVTPTMDEGFIFPELILFGQPEIPYEFELMPFLAQGSGPYLGAVPGRQGPASQPIIGQLSPWPGAAAPAKATCAPGGGAIPVANAGPDVAFRPNTLVTLAGSSDTINLPENEMTFAWVQTAGPTVTLTNAGTKAPSFTAPAVTAATVFTFELTVSNSAGSTTDTVNVTVSTTARDTIRVLSATVTKINGRETLTVLGETSVKDGSSILSVSATGTRPDVPLTAMFHLGNGRWTWSGSVDRDPTLVTIRSSWGSVATWIPTEPVEND